MTASVSHLVLLSDRLKRETDPAHRRLEASMGFDIHQPDRALAIAMLRGFYSVLVTLEPAMLALVPAQLAAGRDKLRLLRQDLLALGEDPDGIAVPTLSWLPQTHAEALGALYVAEGSTLGSKVIVKALRRLPNWPISGISYFDPYGAETGTRWQAFQAYLDRIAPDQANTVIDAATQTFVLFEQRLVAEVKA